MDKKVVLIIITAAPLVCLLFLPFGSFIASVSLWDILDRFGIDFFFDDFSSLCLLASVIAAIAGVVFAALGRSGSVFICSWVGLGGIGAYLLISFFDGRADLIDFITDAFDIFGAGFWLGVGGFVASMIISKNSGSRSNYNNYNNYTNYGGGGNRPIL